MTERAGNGSGSRGLYDYARIRARMVEKLRREYGIRDERVLAAMNEVPRHLFVPEALRGNAYGDHALPIAGGQTISQPYIVARATELLELSPDARVLEIGAGSGYQTAILAKLARSVFAIERLAELARGAQKLLNELRLTNVILKCFDGTTGWKDFAPYAGILVAAGSPEIPAPLVEQLAVGGRLVIPVGTAKEQRLMRVTRTETGTQTEDFGRCQFVRLIGQHGWKNEE
ncbi:MAG TPA: protein-L-isoaspartate(D-aspartate) O-methyltransferase [Blastocatellia bacterium]|nr:protein-L-isoaspartate(D-aspartate) O-methyltransferase [Blastocatellia bacterium]